METLWGDPQSTMASYIDPQIGCAPSRSGTGVKRGPPSTTKNPHIFLDIIRWSSMSASDSKQARWDAGRAAYQSTRSQMPFSHTSPSEVHVDDRLLPPVAWKSSPTIREFHGWEPGEPTECSSLRRALAKEAPGS
ncbi:uncharacterized protein CLUP02_06036 [Colletotrichum lupini]|uniref:Uncharacterized protein n=1 Tax=Colletotrichum lupini TaxID=145971 RepID=A0A9Q8SNX6_9PEZI|nr:uncharacterized protein CLUP02_06036 [Colletotrichum lupini]UQC80553.1 hypothetical protein CLUP02_06036 [Colletotrichum lupini]